MLLIGLHYYCILLVNRKRQQYSVEKHNHVVGMGTMGTERRAITSPGALPQQREGQVVVFLFFLFS